MLRRSKIVSSVPGFLLRSSKRTIRTITGQSLSKSLQEANTLFGDDIRIQDKITTITNILPLGKLREFAPSTITLGILQASDIEKGLFVDSLIVDPLSNDNKVAQLVRKFRQKNPNSNVKLIKGNCDEHVSGGIFTSKSPVLDSELRLNQDAKFGDGTSRLLNRETFNNISFVEVNDPSFTQKLDVEGAENLDLSNSQKDAQIKPTDIQIWIYVKSDTSDVDKINDLPYLVLVNRPAADTAVGESLVDELERNNFAVDLKTLEHANKLATESVHNISEYLKLYQKSNINELLYTINRETSGYKPLILLLRNLMRDLHVKKSGDIEIAKQLKEEIVDWTQNAHFELQSKVTPFLENAMLRNLTKLNQLILNSGDLTLVISNLLNGTRAHLKNGLFCNEIECYGSLVESNSKSHYLRGRIDTLFPDKIKSQVENSKIDNLLEGLKDKVANDKLPSLQSRINGILINELFASPFIVFVLSNVGYVYDFITLNTCMALTALTIAVTANTSQKSIIKAVSEFKDWYIDQLRVYIDKMGGLLLEKLDQNINDYELTQERKRTTVEELRSITSEIERIDSQLKVNTDTEK
ncbi:hypothetical protein CAS74_000987 [Pichia kudriavzevii]|uniref:Mmc1 C-terminal domain-containing protein n=1 Tax=Pichia kudriavzevii TaxID=4909 RepID=A0A1Z8JVQ2_PICKU|nr:hypothetical protein CAS74_000987 [Pichia kudriavzevii]